MKHLLTTSKEPPDGFRLRFPTILSKVRSELGKQIRHLYKNDIGVPYQAAKGYAPRIDGISNTITTFVTDNNIIYLNDMNTRPEYKPNPTKDDLRDYFAPRIVVRKMVPKEAGKLMGLTDSDIEKIESYPFKTYAERKEALANADKKETNRIKRESICKTAQYRCYGNSICVPVLEALFYKMFINTTNDNSHIQQSLFD